jgi:hypothetical protein
MTTTLLERKRSIAKSLGNEKGATSTPAGTLLTLSTCTLVLSTKVFISIFFLWSTNRLPIT